MKPLDEIMTEVNKCIDDLETTKLSFTQPRSEILDKLSTNYYHLTDHRVKFHEDWMSVYFNSKAKSHSAKERESDIKCPEMYKIRHVMSSVKLVIDSLRTSISANKN